MKKLMVLVAILALVLAAAVPAIAQVANSVGQETSSGDVNVAFDVASEGDFAQQCVAPLQFADTGNLQNGQAALQYASTAGDISLAGSTQEFFTGPGAELSFQCSQQVQQSAAASS